MPQRFDPAKLNRQLRDAQRKMERAAQREVDRVNRENERRVDAHNRRVEQHNKRQIDRYNRDVDKVNADNRAVVTELNRRLRIAGTGPRYTDDELVLADRIRGAVADRDNREWDAFLSYAKIDGARVGNELREHLERLGVRVWFDEVAIVPGQSQALRMDADFSGPEPASRC